MTKQHAYCTTLGVTNRNSKFLCARYHHILSWKIIPHLGSYCKIGAPGHNLMNYKWIIYLYYGMECGMFNYFEFLSTKLYRAFLVNHFIDRESFLLNWYKVIRVSLLSHILLIITEKIVEIIYHQQRINNVYCVHALLYENCIQGLILFI